MIAQKEILEIKPVEKAPAPVEYKPAIARTQPQPKWSDKLFIASNVCLLTGLLLMVIAILLPVGVVTTIETVFALSLVLLITEVSLFVVGGELFALGFIWPRIK
jgi:hypothetical protein